MRYTSLKYAVAGRIARITLNRPARVWGCPTTAMWVYQLGAEKAKRMAGVPAARRRR